MKKFIFPLLLCPLFGFSQLVALESHGFYKNKSLEDCHHKAQLIYQESNDKDFKDLKFEDI